MGAAGSVQQQQLQQQLVIDAQSKALAAEEKVNELQSQIVKLRAKQVEDLEAKNAAFIEELRCLLTTNKAAGDQSTETRETFGVCDDDDNVAAMPLGLKKSAAELRQTEAVESALEEEINGVNDKIDFVQEFAKGATENLEAGFEIVKKAKSLLETAAGGEFQIPY